MHRPADLCNSERHDPILRFLHRDDDQVRPLIRAYGRVSTSTHSAGGLVGRLGGSQLGDRWGAMNVYLLSVFLSCILTLCWSAVDGAAGIAAFAVVRLSLRSLGEVQSTPRTAIRDSVGRGHLWYTELHRRALL